MTSRALRVSAAILMAGGLALVTAPLAASAHTGKLFSYGYQEPESEGFVSIAPTTAALSLLSANPEGQPVPTGADICDDVSWAIGYIPEDAFYAFLWNHDTGASSAVVPMTASVSDFPESSAVAVADAWAADSHGPCGTGLVYVSYSVTYGGDEVSIFTVSYVNWTTGAVTPIAELPTSDGDTGIYWTGIATNPVTGIISLFAEIAGLPYVSVLTLGTGLFTEPVLMSGIPDYFESQGVTLEWDFQPDGKLWTIYGVNNMESFRLLSFAVGADLTSAEPTDVGPLVTGGTYVSFPDTLTYDPALLPVSGGTPLPVIAFGGALLLGGAVLLGIRRRVAG